MALHRLVPLTIDEDNDPDLSSDAILKTFLAEWVRATVCVGIVLFDNGDSDRLVIRQNEHWTHAEMVILRFLDTRLTYDDECKIRIKMFMNYSPCKLCCLTLLVFIEKHRERLEMEIIFSRLYYQGEDLRSNPKMFDKACGIALKVMNTRYWKELSEILSLWERERLVMQFENRSEINSRHEEMFKKIRVDCIEQVNENSGSEGVNRGGPDKPGLRTAPMEEIKREEAGPAHAKMDPTVAPVFQSGQTFTDPSSFERITIPVQPSQADDARKQETCNFRKRSFHGNDINSTPPKQVIRGPRQAATQFSTRKTPNAPVPSTSTLCRKTLF